MSDFAKLMREAAEQTAADAVAATLATTAIFAEEPVSLRIFVQDRNYLNNPPLSEVQYEAVRHIERVYYQGTYELMAREFEAGKQMGRYHVGTYATWRDEPYWSKATRMINFATLQWGKGGGKDHICRVASMRIAYLLLCLASPQEYYGLPEQDTIHLLNVASSSAQAQQAFFMPVVRAVRKGWFTNRCEARQNTISFEKNIEAVSGHSDAETQEGLNLMLGIADEIDAFKSKKEMTVRRGGSSREPTKSAEGILNMIRTSGATRFPDTFKRVAISYPRYLGSTIQRLTKEGQADIDEKGIDSRHYVSGPLATWEVNPRVTGKDVFASDYAEDPVLARSKYECKPSRAINPYFRNHQALDACFEYVETEPIAVSYRRDTASGMPVWIPKYEFSSNFIPVRGAAYAMHADMAITADRAGLAMAHVVSYSEHETFGEDEDGAPHPIRELRPNVKVDFVIHYSADASADPAREIQIRWARQLCFELVRQGFNIQRFSFDGFQCLAGETQILLHDGTRRAIADLVGTAPFWVHANSGGRTVPGLCTRAWKTGRRDDMVTVEVSDGSKTRATQDHLFMLAGGNYRMAGKLEPGDRLMCVDPRYAIEPADPDTGSGTPGLRVVVSVEPAPPCDVYDLTVSQYRNFAVAPGFFVHNSTDSMQILEARGISSEKISTDLHENPWRNLRDLAYEGRLIIPRLAGLDVAKPPPSLLRTELLSLTRLPTGRIDHPYDGSKDLADAVACAVLGAVIIGGSEEESSPRAYCGGPAFTVGKPMSMPLGTNFADIWDFGSSGLF
jgi:hypothetical protein